MARALTPFPLFVVAAIVSALTLAAAPRSGWATEIAAPAPLTDDIGRPDARTYLARWLGDAAPSSSDALVTTTDVSTQTRGSMITASDGRPALALPVPQAAHLPPLALFVVDRPRTDDAFDVVMSNATTGPALGTVTGGAVSGLRFDVRPADRNPIALGGDALDEVTARVVRTPEPGTWALFALGLTGLALAAATGRRQRSRSS